MINGKTDVSKSEKMQKSLKLFAGLIIAVGLILLTVYFFPQIMQLKDEAVREKVRDFITDKGTVGILLMLGVQLLQVILSVIPGEPVEILFGFIYGPWLGALLCLFAMLLGSFAVFTATRALGKNFMAKVERSGKYEKLKFLKDPTKRDALIFILFFLPGTPKDTLTYFAPFTKIEPGKFLLISTLGRIPSVITSTFAGESIFSGDYISSVIIFCITGAVGIAGITVYNTIVKKHNRTSTDIKENDNETKS
ncbi:MAG: VTT domain-containing protein [Clostridia bacterium]|nr:VTT domain-containing protein [Clostridia bacterium]